MSGRILGDYEVIKQIGQGALGTVFLAEHRFMKRQYMLKVLPEELAEDRAFVQRFQEAASVLSGLEHPNIVKIHNVTFSQGLYFLVSDCVVDDLGETTNLAQYLTARGESLSDDEIYEILIQVAQALDHVHSKKRGEGSLIHGGLKLNNILVGKTPPRSPRVEVMLCDFGLSSIIGDAAMLTRTLKVVAESLGVAEAVLVPTPGNERYPNPPADTQKLSTLQQSFLQSFSFLAPEQRHRIGDQPLDAAVDSYAFGVLAYMLVMGELPDGYFAMPTEVGHLGTIPWDALLRSCLQKDPHKRPSALTMALESVRKAGGSPAAPQPQQQSAEGVALLTQLRQSSMEQENPEQHTPTQAQEPVLSFGSQPEAATQQPAQSTPAPPPQMPTAVRLPTPPSPQASQMPTAATATLPPKVAVPAPASAPNTLAPSMAALSQPTATAMPMAAPAAPLVSIPSAVVALPSNAMVSAPQEEAVPRPVLSTPQMERPIVDPDPAASLQVDPTVKQYHPEENTPVDVQPIATEMVIIEGGSFWRGSTDGNRDEMPRHEVTLNSFALDIHPVTNEQFVRFLEMMGGEKDHNHQDLIKLKESRLRRSAGRVSIESGYSKHPVVGVTWYGAVAYAKWVGKRLPTEAEWEAASSSNSESPAYPYGREIEKSQANFFSSDTTAVMSYTPNSYGLFDIAGNVYEWCQDWYGYNSYESAAQEPDNPTGPVQGVYRVLRGGCWKSLKEDLRCSRRHRNNPGSGNSTYGFRCATNTE